MSTSPSNHAHPDVLGRRAAVVVFLVFAIAYFLSALLRAVATRLRVHPARCVLVEDTVGHLKAARRQGMGTVWMALSKPTYGIHGTPEPSRIGKTQSHGCIRLTNWSAQEVAAAVAAGTPARLQE